LNGWNKAGTRPVFTLVTGVNTGALTALFAFLGDTADRRLLFDVRERMGEEGRKWEKHPPVLLSGVDEGDQSTEVSL
jgi:hypothetical protein